MEISVYTSHDRCSGLIIVFIIVVMLVGCRLSPCGYRKSVKEQDRGREESRERGKLGERAWVSSIAGGGLLQTVSFRLGDSFLQGGEETRR